MRGATVVPLLRRTKSNLLYSGETGNTLTQGHFSLLREANGDVCVSVNEVSSNLCKFLTVIMVKTYLQIRDATGSLDVQL